MIKKQCTLLMLMGVFTVFFYSCAAGKEYHNMVVYKDTPLPKGPVYLRSIQLEPSHSMRGFDQILPDTVKSILMKYGLEVTGYEEESTFSLDIFLQRREYQREYETYESLTLTLALFEGSEPLAFMLHTEDTPSSIDSFPLLCSILDENLSLLSGYITSHAGRYRRIEHATE